MAHPLVSVNIAAYNAEDYIQEAIYSILKQSYENIEIVIADDGSTDNTRAIINSIKNDKIRLSHNNKNLGYLKTFNKLLFEAKGEFITFLDADDFIHPNKLKLQMEAFSKDQELGLVGTNYAKVNLKGKLIDRSSFPKEDEKIKKYLETNNDVCILGSSVMVRKEVRDIVGGYREFFADCPGEDYDWIRRISEKYKVENIPLVGYYYRYQPNSLTRRVYFSIKQRHVFEIIKFLSEQRDEKGYDDLENSNSKDLEKYMEQLEEPYIKDPSMMMRKAAFDYALNKSYRQSFKSIFKSISTCFFQWRNYWTLLLILIILIFPVNFLLRVKSLLAINHVSSKL